jgi:Uncharacterized bacitracin resistance protein
MDFLQAIILGIIQGLTEFLPISSTGHMVIMEHLLGVKVESDILLAVSLHMGTLVAIFVVFKNDVKYLLIEKCRMISDIFQNAKTLLHNKKDDDARRYIKIVNNNYRKFMIMIMASTIATAVIAIILRPLATQSTHSLLATGTGMLITAVFLIVVSLTKMGKKVPLDIDVKVAFIVGIFQGCAVLPGISRLGITIAICLLCGFSQRFATKYSLILAIPTLIGAGLVTIATIPKDNFTFGGFLIYLVAIVVAAIVGTVCIKFSYRLIKKQRLKYFAGYCFVIGIITIIYHFLKI